jgi:cytochrome c biogenesis protein CcdA
MLHLSTVLIPILLADIVNPVLFAFMVYAVGTDQPVRNSIAALLGHTTAYLTFGIGLALTFDIIMDRLANPAFIDYILSLLVGTLLLWAAWGVRGDKQQQKPASNLEQLTPIKAFGIGAIINIVGLPFALPYFAALDQILKADLTMADSALVIIGYNIGYTLPFLVVPLLAITMGERSRPVLARINEKVDRVSAILMPFILAFVGIALVVDAINYLATGKGLF